MKNSLFYRVFNYQIVNQDLIGLLADAINSADSLLNYHWIPGKVVVHYDRSALQIDTLTPYLGGKQDRNFLPRKKVIDRRFSIINTYQAVNLAILNLTIFQRNSEVIEGSPKKGKHHNLTAVSTSGLICTPDFAQ